MLLRTGLPDILLPLAQGEHKGLGVEFKIKPNKPTENQKQVAERLSAQGSRVEVCYNFEEAKGLLEDYLKP